jgi:hypothetical protein
MTHVSETPALTTRNYSCAVEHNPYDNTYQLRSFLLRKNREPNAFQLVQQEMFKKAMEFVLSLSSLLLLSNRTGKRAVHLSFIMAYVYGKAIIYTGSGFSIDYQKVLVTRGNLPTTDMAIARAAFNSISFTWGNNVNMDVSRSHDKAILVVYCEALNKFVYIIGEARRRDEQAILEVPQFHGYEVQTWLSFQSTDKKYIADSIYTGPLFVT